MKIKLYQADAFTDKIFGGNPAAVCPLENWLADDLMQSIALENNLAETAFFIRKENNYHIRWFTPVYEVDLCGHATLAAAYVIFTELKHDGNEIKFNSRSGELSVRKNGEMLVLNFPADKIEKINPPAKMITALGATPVEYYKGKTDYLLVYSIQEQIERMTPDFRRLSEIDARGIIVTAKEKECDFVSRFFAPQAGIDEDPVTGSAHTTLTPYWAGKLGKTELSAIQLSKRKGYLKCKLLDGRVEIAGEVKLYMKGEIEI